MTMIGTATTPLITALQNSALIGSSGLKLSAAPIDGRHRDGAVEGLRPLSRCDETDAPRSASPSA